MDYPFTSDGCTLVADLDVGMKRACLFHDWEYWIGGTAADRAAADRRFRENILSDSKWWWLAWPRWIGVRIGASPWFPFSWTRSAKKKWRWGFGWAGGRRRYRPQYHGEYSRDSEYPKFAAMLRRINAQA